MNHQAKTRNFSVTSITPHISSTMGLCIHCGHQHPSAAMLMTYPVPGLQVWHCEPCQELLADKPKIQQAKLIANSKAKYLNRKGYKALAGDRLFAANARLKKGVAFVNGTFDREEFKRIHMEAEKAGLTRWTVLVNGLVTYTGGDIRAIRIDYDEAHQFTVEEIEADFMADVRASKPRGVAQ